MIFFWADCPCWGSSIVELRVDFPDPLNLTQVMLPEESTMEIFRHLTLFYGWVLFCALCSSCLLCVILVI